MGDFSNVIQIILSLSIVKIGVAILIFLYIIFTFVVLIQVITMNKVVKQAVAGSLLFTIAIINFIAAISLFILALVIL